MCLGSRSQVSQTLHKRPSSQLFEALLLDVELTSADGHLLAYFDSQPSARNTEPPESATTHREAYIFQHLKCPACAPQLVAFGPFHQSLWSFCGPACLEQPGTDENIRAKIPVFSRLSPTFAARSKVLILRLFIGE
jgi:hypothetical protein